MASGGEGGLGLLSPRRHDTGAPPAPFTTPPLMENAPATKAMTTAPSLDQGATLTAQRQSSVWPPRLKEEEPYTNQQVETGIMTRSQPRQASS
jgi:hypothetical protein